mgnify:CR=1 FL=1
MASILCLRASGCAETNTFNSELEDQSATFSSPTNTRFTASKSTCSTFGFGIKRPCCTTSAVLHQSDASSLPATLPAPLLPSWGAICSCSSTRLQCGASLAEPKHLSAHAGHLVGQLRALCLPSLPIALYSDTCGTSGRREQSRVRRAHWPRCSSFGVVHPWSGALGPPR